MNEYKPDRLEHKAPWIMAICMLLFVGSLFFSHNPLDIRSFVLWAEAAGLGGLLFWMHLRRAHAKTVVPSEIIFVLGAALVLAGEKIEYIPIDFLRFISILLFSLCALFLIRRLCR